MNLQWLILAQAGFEVLKSGGDALSSSSGSASNQAIITGLLVLVVGLMVGSVVALFIQRRRANQSRHARQQEHLTEMYTEMNLGAEERRTIEEVTGSVNPSDHIAMMESRPTFERRAKAFRERNPEHPALRRLGGLRQRLGFGFGNNRIPFGDTRMLSAGQRLQCKIPHPKRELSFVTTVVAASETQFWIRPPAVKGKPVSLEKFPELAFRVSRENDAEYEFTCKVMGQSPTAMRPVALEHTDQIRRLFFRNAPRIPVDLAAQFYVVRQEAAEKAHALLRARDSQYMINGKLRDLSVGGALAAVAVDDTAPHDGDTLIFRLPAAQIRDDLVAEVVRTVPQGGNQLLVHLQFAGLKELDRLKLNKYLTNLVERGPVAPSSASGPAAPTP